MSTASPKDKVAPQAVETKDAQLVPLLVSIAKSSRAFLTLLLGEIGLHPGQDQLLQTLEPGGTISVSVLAEQLAVRPSTVSKMLDRLIERDLVSRASSNKDARRTMVVLTEEGAKARRSVQAVWSHIEAELRSSFNAAEFDDQMRTLGRIDDLLAAKLRRLRQSRARPEARLRD